MSLPMFLDVETGGLDPEENALLSVGFVITDENYNAIFEDEVYTKDYHKKIDREALEKNGINVDVAFSEGLTSDELFEYFKRLKQRFNVDKFILFGWNIQFDVAFLRRFLGFDRFNEVFDYMPIDVASVYFYYAREMTSLQKAVTLLSPEWKNANFHNALVDAKATLEVWRKLLTLGDNY